MKLEHLKIIDEVLNRWPGTTWMALSQLCPDSSFSVYYRSSGGQYKARLYGDGTWALSPRGISDIEHRIEEENQVEWSVYEFEPEETYDTMEARRLVVEVSPGDDGHMRYAFIDEMQPPTITWPTYLWGEPI